MTVIETDILAVPGAAANGPGPLLPLQAAAVFRACGSAPAADGHTLLLDGTNASDDAGDRPGMQALRELEVRSPLRECGLTKDEVRRLSREAGLFTWDKPAYACLATRIPTGTAHHSGGPGAGGARGGRPFPPWALPTSGCGCWEDGARIQVTEAQMALAAGQNGRKSWSTGTGLLRTSCWIRTPRQASR